MSSLERIGRKVLELGPRTRLRSRLLLEPSCTAVVGCKLWHNADSRS